MSAPLFRFEMPNFRPHLTFTRKEWEWLKALQVKKRWDWPAVFSTNEKREIFAYPARRGWTKEHEREQVRGLSTMLDAIGDTYLKQRSEGGRFFIDDQLACYNDSKELKAGKNVFVTFEIVD
jgi:hypothetical protein